MSLKKEALEINRKNTRSNKSQRVSLEVSLARKKQCEAKAMEVVLSLIETSVSVEYLEGVGRLIRRNHYQDVTEERALDKHCGYPLCDNSLHKIPAQKYHISAKSNKVYDISERKNFCCNQCFKSSKYVEEQLLTSPVWLDDEDENVCQPLRVLKNDFNRGSAGIEVDFGKLTLKPEAEELFKLDRSGHRSRLEQSQASETVHEVDDENIGKESNLLSNESSQCPSSELLGPSVVPSFVDTKSSPEQTNLKEMGSVTSSQSNDMRLESVITSSDSSSPATDAGSILECKDSVTTGINRHRATDEKVKTLSNPFDVIEKRLMDWMTVNTVIFILGDQNFQEMLKDAARQSGQVHDAARALSLQQHYVTLCRKLDLEEARDKKADESLMNDHDSDDETIPAKPPPTMEELQTTESQLKVLAFYKGYMEPLPTAPKEVKTTVKLKLKGKTSLTRDSVVSPKNAVESLESSELLGFPLLDSLSQVALRRRIVLDRLNNACSELLGVLGLTQVDVAGGLRKLVQTLRLDAHNITLKPAEWPFVAIIFLKLLAIRDSKLQHAMDSKTSLLFLETLLKGLNKSVITVQSLIDKLLDLNLLLNKGS